ITFVPILRHMQQNPSVLRRRPLWLIQSDPEAPLGPFVAAAFGCCEPGLLGRTNVIAHQAGRVYVNTGTSAFTHLCLDMSREGRSWLEMTCLGLNVSLCGSFTDSPTIVLVDSVAADLALFWTLRTTRPHELPCWMLPVPAGDLSHPAVFD